MRGRRVAIGIALIGLLAMGPVIGVRAGEPSPGATSVGDAIVPWQGNGGFDVRHYDLALTIDPVAGTILDAMATVTATATQDLSVFSLDFVGLEVEGVTVDGAPAEVERIAQDLLITPSVAIADGAEFTTVVRYAGTPAAPVDKFVSGWWHEDETVFIVGEPSGAERWFPVNGHPSDGATYALHLTVPMGVEVVASGSPVGESVADGWTTTDWAITREVPPYVVSFVAGDLVIEERPGPDGVRLVIAYPPGTPQGTISEFAQLPRMIETLSACYGPLPIDRVGGVVVSEAFPAALEAENIPIYGAESVTAGTVAHELAHQWFGNDVRLANWSDLWLNEGFARYAEILWAEASGGAAAKDEVLARQRDAVLRFHGPEGGAYPIADPPPDGLFDGYIYSRGALTLEALRETVGDPTFCDILRTWHEERAGSTGSTNEFIATAERVAGAEVGPLLEEWVYSADLPAGFPEPAESGT